MVLLQFFIKTAICKPYIFLSITPFCHDVDLVIENTRASKTITKIFQTFDLYILLLCIFTLNIKGTELKRYLSHA